MNSINNMNTQNFFQGVAIGSLTVIIACFSVVAVAATFWLVRAIIRGE